MLEEVLGVTASAASGIASRYPTFAELMEAFELAETAGGVDKAELLLADCDVSQLSRPQGSADRRVDQESAKWCTQWAETEQGRAKQPRLLSYQH